MNNPALVPTQTANSATDADKLQDIRKKLLIGQDLSPEEQTSNKGISLNAARILAKATTKARALREKARKKYKWLTFWNLPLSFLNALIFGGIIFAASMTFVPGLGIGFALPAAMIGGYFCAKQQFSLTQWEAQHNLNEVEADAAYILNESCTPVDPGDMSDLENTSSAIAVTGAALGVASNPIVPFGTGAAANIANSIFVGATSVGIFAATFALQLVCNILASEIDTITEEIHLQAKRVSLARLSIALEYQHNISSQPGNDPLAEIRGKLPALCTAYDELDTLLTEKDGPRSKRRKDKELAIAIETAKQKVKKLEGEYIDSLLTTIDSLSQNTPPATDPYRNYRPKIEEIRHNRNVEKAFNTLDLKKNEEVQALIAAYRKSATRNIGVFAAITGLAIIGGIIGAALAATPAGWICGIIGLVIVLATIYVSKRKVEQDINKITHIPPPIAIPRPFEALLGAGDLGVNTVLLNTSSPFGASPGGMAGPEAIPAAGGVGIIAFIVRLFTGKDARKKRAALVSKIRELTTAEMEKAATTPTSTDKIKSKADLSESLSTSNAPSPSSGRSTSPTVKVPEQPIAAIPAMRPSDSSLDRMWSSIVAKHNEPPATLTQNEQTAASSSSPSTTPTNEPHPHSN